MAFQDYDLNPAANTALSDGTFIGPNMLRTKVRPALQQLAADGRGLFDYIQSLLGLATGPIGPAGAGTLNAEDYGAVADGVTASQDGINAALAAGNVQLVKGATYAVSSPVLVPSGRKLYLNGATIKMISPFTDATVSGSTINAVIGAVGQVAPMIFGPGTVDGNKVGGGAFRKNGFMMRRTTGFIVEGSITVKNCTGYACFALGDRITGVDYPSSGVFRTVNVLNSMIHFEQMACDGVTVEDCTSGDGDGDIACGQWLHPVFNAVGSKNIFFIRHRGKGLAGAAVDVMTDSLVAQSNIHLVDCVLEVTGAGTALVVQGTGGHSGIKVARCKFLCPDGVAANLSNMTASTFEDCDFAGKQIGVDFATIQADFINCRNTVIAAPGQGAAGYGNALGASDTTSTVRIKGGTISLTSDTAKAPISGAGIRMGADTVLTGISEDGSITVPASTYYYALMSDQNRTIKLALAGDHQYLMIYPQSVTGWPVGTKIYLQNKGAGGTKTFYPEPGVTLNGVGGFTAVKLHGTGVAEYQGGNVWTVSGDLQ